MPKREYDLLIIGHSIPPSDKKAIIAKMLKHCRAPVLALLRVNESKLDGATESVHANRPDLLVAAVERLVPNG